MYKKILGNGYYEMNYEGDIRKVDGSECDLPIDNGFITLEMYGTSRRVAIDWLKYIVLYELYLPNEFIHELFNVNVISIINHLHYKRLDKDGNIIEKKRPDKILKFKRPLIINGKYSIIPSYPKYAISKEGKLVETLNFETELNITVSMVRGYDTVNIYDPFLCKNSMVGLHRLLGMAWLSKDYVDDKTYINHIDGNKQNTNLNNLEWCNPKHNCNHAVNEKLRPDNIPCKIRDRITGEIKEYKSISAGLLSKGRKKGLGALSKIFRDTKIYNDRYEIRMEGDDRPWLYENVTDYIIPGRYTIDLTINGESKRFTDVRSLIKYYKLWNIPSQGLNAVMEIMKERYPDIQYEIKDSFLSGPYQSLNIKTKEVKTFSKLREMSESVKMSRSVVTKVLRSKEPTEAYGYSFRVYSNDPWPESFRNIARQQNRISAVNNSTKEKLEFNSIREVAKFFSLDKNTIRKKIDNKLPILGFELSLFA